MEANVKKELNYFAKVSEALELIGESNKIDDIMKAMPVFKEVHDYVQDVPMFTGAKTQYDDYKNEMISKFPNLPERIRSAYKVFLQKAVGSPTSLHAIGCVILQVPMIYEFMEEYQSKL